MKLKLSDDIINVIYEFLEGNFIKFECINEIEKLNYNKHKLLNKIFKLNEKIYNIENEEKYFKLISKYMNLISKFYYPVKYKLPIYDFENEIRYIYNNPYWIITRDFLIFDED